MGGNLTSVSLAALIVLVAAISGCTSRSGSLSAPSPASPGPSAAERLEPRPPAAAPNSTGSSNPAPSGPTITHREGDWTLGVSAAGERPNFSGSHGYPIIQIPAKQLTGVIVELAWTPTTALSDSLRLEVQDGSGTVIGFAEGPSPVRVVLEGNTGSGEIVLKSAAAGEANAYVLQAFDFYVSAFNGIPFDKEFSAVET
jgi:hypothetical protein